MGETKAEHHQHHATHPNDQRQGPIQRKAQRTAQRTQGYEDKRKPGHEGHGLREDVPSADLAVFIRPGHGRAGQVAQIDGHQRQHARREKRHQAKKHGEDESQILSIQDRSVIPE